MMETVLKIPSSAKQKFGLLLNDHQSDVTIRNAIILLLAVACPDDEAAEVILHLWYSMALTKPMLVLIKRVIGQFVRGTLSNFSIAPDCREEKGAVNIISSLVKVGKVNLQLHLDRNQWRRLVSIATADEIDFQSAEASRLSTNVNPTARCHIDSLQLGRRKTPIFRRVADSKFRQTGILLPFGASTGAFNSPNP